MRKTILIIAAVFAIAACSKNEQAEGYGYLSVKLSSDEISTVVVKGSVPDDMTFALQVKNSTTGEIHLVDDSRNLESEPLKLAPGSYTITASSGISENAVWNSPVYSGTATVVIRPETVSTASIKCRLATTMVTVELPEDIDSYFSDYRLSIDNGTGSPLTFSKSAGNIKDTAYLAVTGLLKWNLDLVNKDVTPYSTGTITRNGVKAGQHYHLIFSLGEDEDKTGGSAISVAVDDVLNEKSYPIVIDFDSPELPTITADFDLSGKLSSPMGSHTESILKFTAARGIKSLTIITSDAALIAAGLPVGTELAEASVATVEMLNAAGISAGSIAFGSTSASIGLSGLLAKLPMGQYVLTVNVIDIKNHCKSADIRIDITSPVDAEALSAIAWGKFAILSGNWFSESMPAGTRFQYKKKADTQWIDFASELSFDEANKVFTGELCGLEPSTQYLFKAVSDRDTETREITFDTEGAEEVPNLSFDNWYMNEKCWYPNASSEETIWDSANPGTSRFGAVPTTPEENDLAVAGEGKKAARLESMTCFGQFAAGNIYTGQFVQVSGLGAILNWGYSFNSRPLALKGYYKYTPKTIDKAKDPYLSLKGTTDNCNIRIFITDWEGMFRINSSKMEFVSDDDKGIIALGQLVSEGTDGKYIKFTVPLEYRSKTRKPNFIVITGAASRYGDYSTGAVGSVLLLDEFSLVYDPQELTETEKGQIGYR